MIKIGRTLKNVLLVTLTTSLFNLASANILQDQYVLDSNSGIPGGPPRVPEGVTFDPLTASFYATSIFGGRITRVDALTGQETLLYQEPSPVHSLAGIKVATLRRLMWVCATDIATNPNFPTSKVVVLRLKNHGTQASLVREFQMPSPFFCNDIALDLGGNAYITNSIGASIMKIDSLAIHSSSAQAQVWATSPDFLPDFNIPGALGQNGIEVTPNNSHVIVAISIPAKIFKIALNNPADIQPIALSGDTFGVNPDPSGDPLAYLAPDGLVFVLNNLYVSYHGALQRLDFQGFDWSSANVSSKLTEFTGNSTITKVYGQLYVIDSEIVPVTQPQLGLPVELPHKIYHVSKNF